MKQTKQSMMSDVTKEVKASKLNGITFDRSGKCLSKPTKDNSKSEDKLKAKINKFCAKVNKDNLPLPDVGDCWFCLLRDKEGKGMSDGDTSHLLSHIKEGYLHGSLLVNAMRFKGYSDQQIGFHYQLKIDSTFRRALRSYLTKKLLPELASR